MTTRERLIDLLTHDIPSGDHRGTLSFSSRVAGAIADHLVDNGVTFVAVTDNNVGNKWIPASEPPKEAGEYIVMIHRAASPTTLLYSAEERSWFEEAEAGDDTVVRTYYAVDYWMPLPKPPKGVE